MNRLLKASALLLALVLYADAEPPLRDWTVTDSLRVRYLIKDWNEPQYMYTPRKQGSDSIVYSPSGSHVFVGLRYCELETDTNVYELRVYSAKDIADCAINVGGGVPRITAKVIMKTGNPGEDSSWKCGAIRKPTWLDDNRIVFMGQNDSANRIAHDLYLLDIRSGETTRLTNIRQYITKEYDNIYEVGGVGPSVEDFLCKDGRLVFKTGYSRVTGRKPKPYPVASYNDLYLLTNNIAAKHYEDIYFLAPDLSVKKYTTPLPPDHAQDLAVVLDTLSESKGPSEKLGQVSPTKNGLSIVITIVESENTAPNFVAKYQGHEIYLLEPDPALKGVFLATAEKVTWAGPDGKEQNGLMMRPRNNSETKPALVIQWQPGWGAFLPDGASSGGLAARSLVGRGMTVLQIESRWSKYEKSKLSEGEYIVETVDLAVAHLEKLGVIDIKRVGMVGFSRTGYFCNYTATHPRRTRITAAAVNDSVNYGLSDYVFSLYPRGIFANEFERQMGGSIWATPETYLAESPFFALSKCISAMLFVKHCQTDGIGEAAWLDAYARELLGSYQRMRRPLQQTFITNSSHQIVKPLARAASMSLNVDWMDFWLNQHERTDFCPAAGESAEMLTTQYTSWHKMRVDWERQQAWEAAGHPVGSTPDEDFKVR